MQRIRATSIKSFTDDSKYCRLCFDGLNLMMVDNYFMKTLHWSEIKKEDERQNPTMYVAAGSSFVSKWSRRHDRVFDPHQVCRGSYGSGHSVTLTRPPQILQYTPVKWLSRVRKNKFISKALTAGVFLVKFSREGTRKRAYLTKIQVIQGPS